MNKIIYVLAALILSISSLQAAGDPKKISPEIKDSLMLAAPDANIIGHVLDKVTREHLPYVTISIKGTMISSVTDETGHYFLINLPEGEHVVEAEAMGYKKSAQKVIVKRDEIVEVNFELDEDVFNLESSVVTATKNKTNKKLSASIVNVVSDKLFTSVSSNTLSESICFQPGVRVENNCSNCGTTQLRINGLEGQYTQILLDSRAIFSSLAGVYGIEQLPVSMIERVEVIRGGGSALFGSSAIGGVVNIITKEPLRNSASISDNFNIIGGKSIDNNLSLNASLVSDTKKSGLYIFGMRRDRDAYDRNGDGFSDIPEIKSTTLGFRGYHRIGSTSKITLEYHHISEYRRGGDQLDLPPHQAWVAEQLDHAIDGGSLTYNFVSPNERHLLNVYFGAQHIGRKSYYGTEMNPDAYGTTKDMSMNAGAQYTYKIYDCGWSPADLSAGIEYNDNQLHDRMLGYNRDMQQHVGTIGAYVQNEWKSEKLNVLIGARLDKHNLMKNVVFSPRANIRYTPAKWIGLRASYSSGFRAPQAFNEDLHVDAVGGTVALIELDENLKPEYSHSVSASADTYFNFGRVQFNLLAEGFFTRLNDVFELQNMGENADGVLIYKRINASGAQVAGLNVEMMIGIPKIFDIQMGYTFQKSMYLDPFKWSDDVEAQKTMYRSPDNYAYLTSNFYLVKGLTLSVFGNVTGSMLVQHAATGESHPFDEDVWTEAFFDAGLKLAYRFKIAKSFFMEVNAGVKNVFDQFQKDIDLGYTKDAGYVYGPSMPRTYFVGLKFDI